MDYALLPTARTLRRSCPCTYRPSRDLASEITVRVAFVIIRRDCAAILEPSAARANVARVLVRSPSSMRVSSERRSSRMDGRDRVPDPGDLTRGYTAVGQPDQTTPGLASRAPGPTTVCLHSNGTRYSSSSARACRILIAVVVCRLAWGAAVARVRAGLSIGLCGRRTDRLSC